MAGQEHEQRRKSQRDRRKKGQIRAFYQAKIGKKLSPTRSWLVYVGGASILVRGKKRSRNQLTKTMKKLPSEWTRPKSKLQISWTDGEELYIRQGDAWNNNGRSKWDYQTVILSTEEAKKLKKVLESVE